MLTELNIKNFAIIDQLHVEFGPGFNALTGETGAGKSILVDAINLLLGSRASAEMIRTGQEETSVEAFFTLEEEEELKVLNRLALEKSGGLLIRRLIHHSGKSRAFLSGNSITLHMLEELGEELVNIYGQHEHHQFLDPLRHIDIVDRSGNLLPLRQAFQEFYTQWLKCTSDMVELTAKQKQRADRMELLAFQSKEIARANLKVGEDEELLSERARLIHAEKLHSIAHQGTEVLYGESGSVVERLKSTLQRLREGMKIDPALGPLGTSIESALFQAEDVASSLRAYGEKIHFDPRRLEAIESRLDELNKLKRKYGPSIAEVLTFKERIDEERKGLESLEDKIADLKKTTANLHAQALASARELSHQRKKVAQDLQEKVETELLTLGMKKVRLGVQIETDYLEKPAEGQESAPRLNEKGIDRVQFLISPNPGEELKPLVRIASGGELSRIMLAMKRIFAEETWVRTLIFDEVDAGIGGGTAEVVGRKLKEISKRHQVFCITHLPQIASFADAHYKVSKKIHGERTFVEVKRLNEEDRLQEVARMLGGLKITGKTLDHAREMLKNAAKKS
ncbi:MAG: DNA repair protein RecN [Deltaproteobacteria bacterium]|nr:DNA repair protein RecN [Deltaproteobacteria bacterium]